MSSSRAHWVTKKAARRAVAAIGSLSTRLSSREATDEVRAITYHRFGDGWPRDPFCVTPSAFEDQMRWLAEGGLALSIDDVHRFVANESNPPRGAVLVTIDDGYRSVLDVALPILREYAIPSVLYVSTEIVGDPAASAVQPEPYLDWPEIETLHKAGMTIGSHSHRHCSLGQLEPSAARMELQQSYDILTHRLGIAPTSFAYPYGTPAHYSSSTGEALVDVGFVSGFVSTHGAIRRRSDPAELRRVKIEGGESMGMFRGSCGGAMDGWSYIDHAICRLRGQRRYRG